MDTCIRRFDPRYLYFSKKMSVREKCSVSSDRASDPDETPRIVSISPPDNENISRKRKYPESSCGSMDGTGTSDSCQRWSGSDHSLLEEVNIPLNTSEWEDDTILHDLHINVIHEVFEPNVVFYSFSDFLSAKNPKKNKILSLLSTKKSFKSTIKTLYDYAMEFILKIDYDEIYSIPKNSVQRLCEETKSLHDDFIQKWLKACVHFELGRGELDEMKALCTRILDRTNCFLSQLLHMVHKMKVTSTGDINEGMFQELFVRFAKIFGLDFVCVPNVSCQFFSIGQREITSVPDALLLDPSRKDDKSYVFAVVKVHGNYSKEEDKETERNFRSASKKQKGLLHIDNKPKGQHVGEMLSVLSKSMFGPSGIFGFLIQATEVTVVAFHAKENFMESLKCGSLPRKECATIKYSEPCNILLKSGRLSLVKTMLDMGNLMEYL